MTIATETKYDVGGVLLDRPFKVRRLGHFGFNLEDVEAGVRFYVDLLGFRKSDVSFTPEGQLRGVFTRYGGDHHAFVLFKRQPAGATGMGAGAPTGVTINQITWQVGSLAEVGSAARWFAETGVPIRRTGRDMPGSNWHTYISDPDGHTNELYYGIEQVGWDGLSKPRDMYYRGFREAPPLPQMNEFEEVQDALDKGIDVHGGYRQTDDLPAKYAVDGVMLPRPFKITRIGPVGLFVQDIDASTRFYTETMGFVPTEETSCQEERCVFLRTNTEHHSLALYPLALRDKLGMSSHTTSAYFGVQLANYRQLRDAVGFLRDNGVRVESDWTKAELHPGIDYAAYAFDPEGHCIQLYCYMEQLGWDGRPRPQSERRVQQPGAWPERLEALPDSYLGEPYLGPWG